MNESFFEVLSLQAKFRDCQVIIDQQQSEKLRFRRTLVGHRDLPGSLAIAAGCAEVRYPGLARYPSMRALDIACEGNCVDARTTSRQQLLDWSLCHQPPSIENRDAVA